LPFAAGEPCDAFSSWVSLDAKQGRFVADYASAANEPSRRECR
jgi:hypothetical protein